MIPAVSYVRMSKDSQDASIPAQRVAIAQYAKQHGYTILREYQDAGISGDATEKRFGFQRMLKDSAKGEFKAILCWDQDRFGRFDLMEAGFWVKPLRDSGIQLVTVAQGVINWNDFAGRLVYSIQQEGKHQYLRDLSRNVNRGKLEKAKSGRWMAGPAPYGYTLGDNQRLLPNPKQAKIVTQIFEWYATEWTMRKIAQTLNERGVASPHGTAWGATALSRIIRNELYLGHTIYNKRSSGKYTGIANDTVITKDQPYFGPNDRSQWVIVRDTHKPLTTQETFNRAQQALIGNKRWSGPPTKRPSMFRQILRCGWCGGRMAGYSQLRLNDTKYICAASLDGKGCRTNKAWQSELLQAVKDTLRSQQLSPSRIAAMKAKWLTQLGEQESSRPSVEAIQPQIDVARKRLAKAEGRLLEVPTDMVAVVVTQIRDLRESLVDLQKKLELASAPQIDVRSRVDLLVDEQVSVFRELVDSDDTTPHEAVTALIRKAFSRITAWCDKEPTRQGKWVLQRIEFVGKTAEFFE